MGGGGGVMLGVWADGGQKGESMASRLGILTLAAVVTFVAVPLFSSGVLAQGHGRNMSSTWQQNGDHDRDRRISRWQRTRYQHHGTWRNTYGYRNYGQYRRTQVGNRRWTMTNRYNTTYNRYNTNRYNTTYNRYNTNRYNTTTYRRYPTRTYRRDQ